MGDESKSFHPMVAGLLMLVTLTGCQLWGNAPEAAKGSGNKGANAAPIPPSPPILEFWDNGNYLAGKVPTLLFAVWSDGRVVRQLANGRLYQGVVPQAIVNQLAERVAISGALQPQITAGLLRPDGNSQLLWINFQDKPIVLRQDASITWDDVEAVPITANPTRRQMETFYEMWTRVIAAIDDIWPADLHQTMGVPGLQYPGM